MSGRMQRQSVLNSQRSRHSALAIGDDAFSYALRTAYLHYLLLPRPRRQVPAPPPQQINRSSSSFSTSRFHEFMGDFSITRGDPKSTRFPKEFLPILQRRLEVVWMGRDNQVEFRDQTVKRTFASFYTVFKEPRFYDTVAESRRPEDLLLIFYSSATKALQQGKEDDSWKPLVDRHVALFVRLMGSIIKQQGWSSNHPELSSLLATLEKKLLRHDENLADESRGNRASSSGGTVLSSEPLSYKVNDMPMVKVVSKVFNIPLEACQRDIDKNRLIWTEKAALQDMKAYTNYLNLNTMKTLRKSDFHSEDAYEFWNKAEKAELSKVMLAIIQSNPQELSKTTSDPATAMRRGHSHTSSTFEMNRSSTYGQVPSLSSVQSAGDADGMSMANAYSVEDDDTPYIYIPPDPRAFYRHVVERCLGHDLNNPEDAVPVDVGTDEPMRILSKASLDLLDQCILRWRLPKFSSTVIFMDCIGKKYAEAEIDLQMLDVAFMYFDSAVGVNHLAWTVADQNMCKTMLSSVHSSVLRELYDVLQHAYDTKSVPIGRVLWVLDQHIYNHDLFVADDMESYIEQLKEGLRRRAQAVLQDMLGELPQERDQLDPLDVVQLTQKIIKLAEKVSKRFGEPVLNAVNPMMIFVEIVFPQYAVEAKDLVIDLTQICKERQEEMAVEDGIQLYKELSEIRRIYLEAFPNRSFPVRLEDFLKEFPTKMIQALDSKVIGWVDAAVQQDDIIHKVPEGQVMGNDRHSSSVVDIFRSYTQSIDSIQKLEWQDDYHYAQFMTAMAKVLGKGISRYCEVLEKLFTYEMDKATPEQEAARSQTRKERWMAIAREAWSNKDKVEPFQFAPESCVKLNDIEWAIQQLDKLEHIVDADRLTAIVAQYQPPLPPKRRHSYVFTVKIVEGEDLKAMDMNGYSDPYVVLGDEYQKRLAKTRIVYSNLNPRWEESFDITTTGPVFLTATIWDWDTVGDHDCLGRANLKLDPANFMDYLPKDYWLDLDTQGRLSLRVSMEGERDDIQFHFGKAFRTLKRTERDMTRQITDKLSAYIHHCLSRSALKNVLSKGYSISAVSSLFSRTGFSTARPNSVATQAVTEDDIAAPITPLTDYFNENFAILNQTLTRSAMTLVMSKLWKEVLVTMEALLVPTLSDKPSQQRQLTPQETEVIFKWLQLMFDFFHAVDETTGEPTGVPTEVLKSPKYHELKSLNFFYFETTENLIRTSERVAGDAAARQQTQRQQPKGPNTAQGNSSFLAVPGMAAKRSKSVLMKRNLGTMRKAKEEKRREAQAEMNDDMILRILRMRPEAHGYLRDRSRQKERLEATAAAEAIVRMSASQATGGSARLGNAMMGGGMRR